MSHSIIAWNIRSEGQLFVKAHEQSTDGKKDLTKLSQSSLEKPYKTLCYRNKILKKLSVQTKGRKKTKMLSLDNVLRKNVWRTASSADLAVQ